MARATQGRGSRNKDLHGVAFDLNDRETVEALLRVWTHGLENNIYRTEPGFLITGESEMECAQKRIAELTRRLESLR